MTYGRSRTTMRDRFEYFKEVKSELKKDFEEFITNTIFGLDVRWKMFLDAPAELSNHSQWIYRGFDKILSPNESDVNWVDDSGWSEKGGNVDLLDSINDLFSDPEEYGISYPGIKENGFINKLKEQLMKDNTKSFTYDW